MTKHTTNRRAFAPRLFPIRITPFLHRVKREWLTACLQQTPAGFPRHFYYTSGVDLSQCVSCFCGDFPLFFACFGSDNFLPAPNQHHTFSYLRQESANTAPPPLPSAFSHIHSKTACRGFKSFCPCQKSQVSLVRYLTFSLVCGRIWQQGAPAGPPAVRVVGRWSPVATVQRRPRRQPRQVRPTISS